MPRFHVNMGGFDGADGRLHRNDSTVIIITTIDNITSNLGNFGLNAVL